MAFLVAAAWGVAAPVWAQEQTYGVPKRADEAPAADPSDAMGAMLREWEAVESVTVAGETLVYDEVAGRADWTGNVTLTAGSLVMTTESLTLNFVADAAGGDPVLQSLTAGPAVDLRAEDGLIELHSEGLTWDFPGESGSAQNTTIKMTLPQDLLNEVDDVPLRTQGLELTIESPEVKILGRDLEIERPSVVLASQGGRELRFTARQIALRNPAPDVTRLFVNRPRIALNDRRILMIPWRVQLILRGPPDRGGLDVVSTRPVNASEGLGLTTEITYGFANGDEPPDWAVGLHPEWIFADRLYAEAFVQYSGLPGGDLRLYYGSSRGKSPLDRTSVVVRREPELVWEGDKIALFEGVAVTPTLGYGHITEKEFDREADRARVALDLDVDPVPLGSDHFLLLLGGKVDQRFYDIGTSHRMTEGTIGLRYFQEGAYGTEVEYAIREESGFSPFLHDRPILREELSLKQRVLGEKGWGSALRLSYDLERDRWNDIDVGLSKSFEIIQLTLYWRAVQSGIGFEVGLPGQI